MKPSKILSLVVVFVLILCLPTAGHCWTYEGQLNPEVFDNWPPIHAVPINPEVMMFIVQNPDPTAEIQRATLIIHTSGYLLAYGYFKNGIEYRFVYDPKTDCYVQKLPVSIKGDSI